MRIAFARLGGDVFETDVTCGRAAFPRCLF